ncbi:MAG: hypothetical protein AB7O96_01845 [Pseudobdellovibrionaceae bacterium]
MGFRGLLSFLLFISSYGNSQSIESLREESRQILRKRLCGVCHIPPGSEKALKIFDLDTLNWSSGMSEGRLEQVKWRIDVKGEEIKEQRGDPVKHEFTEKEKSLVKEYIDAELKQRNPAKSLFVSDPLL